jgi:deoxyuridine 5'-triphosphate nucleotidohydrolase
MEMRPIIPYYAEMPDFKLEYSKEGDAGFNLPIWDDRLVNGEWSDNGEYTLQPMESKTIRTGVYMAFENGSYGQLDTRSGTSKKKIILLCHTIDAPYRGNIHLAIMNLNYKPVTIKNGMSIAQIIRHPFTECEPMQCISYDHFLAVAGKTDRMEKGFNSTGGGFED